MKAAVVCVVGILLLATPTTARDGGKCTPSAELQKMKLSTLINKARSQSGVEEAALTDAMDSDSPKASVITLLQQALHLCEEVATGSQKKKTRGGGTRNQRKWGSQRTIIVQIREIIDSMPDRTTMNNAFFGLFAALALGAVYKLHQAILEAPNLVESVPLLPPAAVAIRFVLLTGSRGYRHGAPKCLPADGSARPRPQAKWTGPTAAKKQTSALLKQFREAMEANMPNDDDDDDDDDDHDEDCPK